jgi:hypothetical protein
MERLKEVKNDSKVREGKKERQRMISKVTERKK